MNFSSLRKLPRFLRVGLLVVLSAAATTATVSAQELEQVTLQLKWKHQFQFAGYYAAIEQGYYRDAGLEVTLREPEVGEESANVVLDGRAQYGVAASDLVVLRGQGKPVVALAAIMQHSPLAFVVRADGPIASVHDLVGRRVMLESHADELLAYLEFEGIDRERIDWVPHTFSPEPLIEGGVEAMSAYVTDEAFLLTVNDIDYVTYSPRAGGIDFYGDVLFTTEGYLARNRDQVERFREASLRGWLYAMTHVDEMVELIYTRYSQRHSRPHLRFEAEHMQRLVLPDVVEVGYQNPLRWEHIADVYEQLGLVDDRVDLSNLVYRPEPLETDNSRLYLALAIALTVIALLTAIIARFAQLNYRIREQADSLRKALSEIKELRGIIPICAGCKKIRNDDGYWDQVETYISAHTNAEFTHGFCEDCIDRLYGEEKQIVPPVPREDGDPPAKT